MRVLATFVMIVAGLSICTNPSIVRVNEAGIGKIVITKVFVPRFEGNPDFIEESTDLFISKFESRIVASIIQGSVLRTESTDVLAGGNLAPAEIAIAKPSAAGAQVVIMGKVTSHHTGDMFNGFSTVRVINVTNGEILASFHRPSGMLFGYSVHQAVMAAVSRTAADVANALE